MPDKKCVFLIDDSLINLNTGKSALGERYVVVTIPSGEKALKLIEKNTPDLILLDIEMPGLSGYDVIKKLKADARTKDIPVIFLTSRSEPESELEGLSLGAVDYIGKPFSPPLLLKRLEMHLLVEEQRRELKNFNDNLRDMVLERTNELKELQNAIINWVAELVEYRDDTTGRHIERVQAYMRLLLDEMARNGHYRDEIADWDIEALIQSSSLHDIGKIKISDDILLKKGRLTKDEYETMKTHTSYGGKMLESLQKRVPTQKFLNYAHTLVTCHHEKWNGAGYPNGIKGEEIPLQARLMSLADVYDALMSKRPYKEPFPHEAAVEIIESLSGRDFDPEIVGIFLSIADQFRRVSEEHKDEYKNGG